MLEREISLIIPHKLDHPIPPAGQPLSEAAQRVIDALYHLIPHATNEAAAAIDVLIADLKSLPARYDLQQEINLEIFNYLGYNLDEIPNNIEVVPNEDFYRGVTVYETSTE